MLNETGCSTLATITTWRHGGLISPNLRKYRLITGRVMFFSLAETAGVFRQKLAGIAHAAKKTTW
jgi:hypothetical protein